MSAITETIDGFARLLHHEERPHLRGLGIKEQNGKNRGRREKKQNRVKESGYQGGERRE